MKQLILVALGGAVGALARWKIGGVILHHTPNWRFPFSTAAVNIAGCIVAGLLGGLVVKRDLFTPDARLFLFTGLLGGFTTFSAFGLDTAYLLRRKEYGVALAYVLVSVVAGVLGLWIAMASVREKSPH